MKFSQQCKLIFNYSVKFDFAEKSRLLSPLLFAVTVILLLSFSFALLPYMYAASLFTAQIYLGVLFAIQLVLLKVFSSEERDGVLQLYKVYPLNLKAIAIGKFFGALATVSVAAIPVLFLSCLFYQKALLLSEILSIAGICIWSLFGLVAMGILLVILTKEGSGRETLLPILYFPLTLPILLASIQSTLLILGESFENTAAADLSHWLLLLTGCNIIYLTLYMLFFEELI